MTGQKLSQYQILEKLGQGGMGVVYQARDTRLERFVALKVLTPDKAADPQSRRRLLREAQAASALNHPNIVTIHDIASAEGTDFIVMEYVDGEPLRHFIYRGGMSMKQILGYVVEITDALAAAHGVGIVHRDLKPGNVMINRSGRVKVLDFGLAKLIAPHGPSAHTLTEPGMVVGTVSYMSPEQARGEPADQRSDVFSFGVMLYEMLAGHTPFQGDNTLAVLSAIQFQPAAPLRDVRADIPPAMQELIAKALAKQPSARHGSMREVASVIRFIADEMAAGRTPLSPEEQSTVSLGKYSVSPQPARPSAPLARPPSPGSEHASIAVLPFSSLSSDPEDTYLAAGIAAEITAKLAGVPGIRVAPHLASFQLKDQASDPQQIARNLNVRYVLTGNLRRAGNKIRVVAQLSDYVEGAVIWSHSYDQSLEDVFAVQDEIARSVVGATGGEIIRSRAESASRAPAESLDAWGLVRKAYHVWNYSFSLEGIEQALELLRRAVELSPNYAPAHAFLGVYSIQRVILFISPDRAADRTAALASAERAFELAPSDPEVLENCGLIWYCTNHSHRSVPALRRAVKIAPFNLVAWGYLAMDIGWGGSDAEVVEAQSILDRLIADTPDHPSLPYWHYFKAGAFFSQENYEAGAEASKRSMELQPRYMPSSMSYANAIAMLGRQEEARQIWQALLAVNPAITQQSYMESITAVTRTPERAERHTRGLFAAGIFTH